MESESLDLRLAKVKDEYKVQKLSGEYLTSTDAKFYEDGSALTLAYDPREISQDQAIEEAVGYLRRIARWRKRASYVSKLLSITQFLTVPLSLFSKATVGDTDIYVETDLYPSFAALYGASGLYFWIVSRGFKSGSNLMRTLAGRIEAKDVTLRAEE